MKSFKDNEGQVWTLTLTLSKVRAIREKLGLDILNPNHYLQILNSLTDRLAFCFLLVEDQAKAMGVSIDDFEERLYGENVATEASMAFLEETEVFTQKLGQRGLAKLAKKSIESMKAGQSRIDEMMESGQLDSLLDQAEKEMADLLQPSGGSGLSS